MSILFWKKKVNPLKSDAELAAQAVEVILNAWKRSVEDREVINLVLSKRLPGTKVHGKPYSKNPKSIYKGKVPYGDTSRGKYLESER